MMVGTASNSSPFFGTNGRANYGFVITFDGPAVSVVPEPGTYAMMGMGLAALLAVSARRRRTILAGRALPALELAPGGKAMKFGTFGGRPQWRPPFVARSFRRARLCLFFNQGEGGFCGHSPYTASNI
ncbi:MAG: PEP-CTERM sorting domain-containing protein [Phycisphaerae bacterium]|nr:PEP-CTERM sorting domain-containing protein [Gemmatimonadaceae bacterium]